MIDASLDRTWLGGLGTFATTVVLIGVAGFPGAIAGVAIILAWVLVADVAAFSVAIVTIAALHSADGFVVLSPAVVQGIPYIERLTMFTGLSGVELLSLTALSATSLLLLLGSVTRTDRPIVVAGLTVLLTVGLAMAAVTPVIAGESILIGAAVVTVLVAVLTYGLHRYSLLVAGVLQHG